MSDSYFFKQQTVADLRSEDFINELNEFASTSKTQVYAITSPLGDDKYTYEFKRGLVVLSPKHNLMFINCNGNVDDFENFVDEFEEDLASISDKFRYKDHIGRRRTWSRFVVKINKLPCSINELFDKNKIESPEDKRIVELLISLLTGSINNIDIVTTVVPDTILDKVKKKIVLFDGEQTRFIYQKLQDDKIIIQGLSGTGKTELLLHKLKEIYTSDINSRVLFTCHNRILASSLRKRIPDFFNFMKVEQQIQWNERLWCVHAWGSTYDINSGAYRYITDFYKIAYNTYSKSNSFSSVCKVALDQLNIISEDEFKYAFDYIFIDESQDFPESFIELCAKVTKNNVYIAGDIFQSIFSSSIVSKVSPTYLLSKCYRTDPKTLMFSHALGMGLFETPKLRWLKDEEWERCGYNLNIEESGNYQLSREPLRRFEDLENFNSVQIIPTPIGVFRNIAVEMIIKTIKDIRGNHATVTADDIAVIFVDNNEDTYYMADKLSYISMSEFGWAANKAYSSKMKIPGQLFVSNVNNVKGLEFPFVICVTRTINNRRDYRNALYTMMTRSFITSFLILSGESNQGILPLLEAGITCINENGYLNTTPPQAGDDVPDDTTIGDAGEKLSLLEVARKIFDELDVQPSYEDRLINTLNVMFVDGFDEGRVRKCIESNYEILTRS